MEKIKPYGKNKINLIFNLIGMYEKARKWNKKNIDNYVEIYIKSDLSKILKLKKKTLYLRNKKNIVGGTDGSICVF